MALNLKGLISTSVDNYWVMYIEGALNSWQDHRLSLRSSNRHHNYFGQTSTKLFDNSSPTFCHVRIIMLFSLRQLSGHLKVGFISFKESRVQGSFLSDQSFVPLACIILSTERSPSPLHQHIFDLQAKVSFRI